MTEGTPADNEEGRLDYQQVSFKCPQCQKAETSAITSRAKRRLSITTTCFVITMRGYNLLKSVQCNGFRLLGHGANTSFFKEQAVKIHKDPTAQVQKWLRPLFRMGGMGGSHFPVYPSYANHRKVGNTSERPWIPVSTSVRVQLQPSPAQPRSVQPRSAQRTVCQVDPAQRPDLGPTRYGKSSSRPATLERGLSRRTRLALHGAGPGEK